MEVIKKAIKHFEYVKSGAVAVLDSGFGTNSNESNIVYKNRKLYAELAINALEKQIPKKPIITVDGFFNGQPIYDTWGCPNCGKVNETDFEDYEYCPICGQALDWGDTQ